MTFSRLISYFAGTVSLLLLLATPALAATEAGRILFARGVVSIVDEQDSARGARTGDVIREGERVITGRSGIAQLRLSDGALIALRASSDYHIQRQSYDTVAGVFEQAGRLATGWMRMVTGAIGANYSGNVSQGTSVATIGIRGTTFQVIHIPEGGLPGYPETEPGTYMMLEEGAIEVTTEGGTRLLQPGDVIWVSSKDAAPQLVPDKKTLFLDPNGTAVSYVELNDSDFARLFNEGVADTLLLPTRPFERLASLGFVGTSFWTESYFERFYDYGGGEVDDVNISTAGTGASRVVTEVETWVGESIVNLQALAGQAPEQQGYVRLNDGSEIIWGVWDKNAYQVTYSAGEPEPAQGDWHYMVGSNVLSDPYMISSQLTGQATYSWVGGTNFMDDAGNTTQYRITGGSALVDFGANAGYGAIQFTLNAAMPEGNFTMSSESITTCATSCGLNSLYFGGLNLDTVGEGSYFGFIQGMFVGDGSGIVTKVTVSDDIDQYYATAAFAGSPDSNPDFEGGTQPGGIIPD
jgi:hypothetical protein